ncbi:MAG: hypothetical protein BTN85_0847 [Candidatus Methanohalarchaeum thermophilum]|uniref:Uncharacterized protein n=1 Tax=Methanohalarchaeum thermophilum TaxID=1903181 RepID=A0A1Q6DVI9_METT1|nr:MAG: hypothetical protein BTN85_0847 [Candidatus Methanohalarchaeum thermophilum]
MTVREDIPEPKDLKKYLSGNEISLKCSFDECKEFFLSELGDYLWEYFKSDFVSSGYNFEGFLKVLYVKRRSIISWAEEKKEWPELVEEIDKGKESCLFKLFK